MRSPIDGVTIRLQRRESGFTVADNVAIKPRSCGLQVLASRF
jgi:hypothetical protein